MVAFRCQRCGCAAAPETVDCARRFAVRCATRAIRWSATGLPGLPLCPSLSVSLSLSRSLSLALALSDSVFIFPSCSCSRLSISGALCMALSLCCRNEGAALPRACRSAGLGKLKLMISCVRVEIDTLGLAPADHSIDSGRHEAAEVAVPQTYRASYWETIHREGFHRARRLAEGQHE